MDVKIPDGTRIDAETARALILAYCTEPSTAVSWGGDLPSPYTSADEIANDIEDGDTFVLDTGFCQTTFLIGTEGEQGSLSIQLFGLTCTIDDDVTDQYVLVAVPAHQ